MRAIAPARVLSRHTPVLTLLFVLIVVGGVGYLVTTPEDHASTLALVRQSLAANPR